MRRAVHSEVPKPLRVTGVPGLALPCLAVPCRALPCLARAAVPTRRHSIRHCPECAGDDACAAARPSARRAPSRARPNHCEAREPTGHHVSYCSHADACQLSWSVRTTCRARTCHVSRSGHHAGRLRATRRAAGAATCAAVYRHASADAPCLPPIHSRSAKELHAEHVLATTSGVGLHRTLADDTNHLAHMRRSLEVCLSRRFERSACSMRTTSPPLWPTAQHRARTVASNRTCCSAHDW